jgi:hypothetical protein
VPEIIVATVDPPDNLAVIGPPKFIEVRALKIKKKGLKGEQHANAVSEKIFFIEYNLHS